MALVVEASTPSKSQLNLCPAILEVDGQRHQGERLLLGTTEQLVDLAPMQQQFPPPVRVVSAKTGRVLVRRYVHTQQPGLAFFDPSVSIGKRDTSGAKGLDLASLKGDAALEGLENVVVVASASVAGNRTVAAVLDALSGSFGPAPWSFGRGHVRRVVEEGG